MKIINKTTSEYVEEQRQEILKVNPIIWSTSLILYLRHEYFEIIIKHLNNKGKITQEVYDDLKNDNMNEYYLNKHYFIHGIKILA